MIHPEVEEAFQQIDAAVFSGDSLEYLDFRARLTYFLKRWQKQLVDTTPNIDRLVEAYENGELGV